MPLQQLVQNDSVEKAAQAKPKKKSRQRSESADLLKDRRP
jgi:hypothetical protein